ncbi:DUF3800 domain-containing protein [Limnoraphis robusta Tam1]|uniref:DUF3800 domain-containing protein n=1 Tax=Limnoraphis robusta CCNP1315 TaxID=3110306 RepID=A0ABU5TXQ7_9CYAN|nr:DUF3800 domain-containing protein [Limnoraphis robusta]MEA5501283.1 DUF3800 domain-containing protein [Limnoraphis robusta BA-68 BA1]MEA5519727.1 DUF3800 domain-containing protein [Limnoraphis robusta CCNP1315]MEA5539198.1 DUF3800 domain-containing protein [Limnoraphis robusta Tam1]MEA5544297.1 DUF3800 domain-containing protein [Limnoraphis robusta CCNP1324]
MSTIFLDESGYTGQDLLNKEQPIFTLASLKLSEQDCQELKRIFFNNVQSTELKYSSLSKRQRPRQQQMILEFLKELSIKPELVKFSLANKQFVLVSKMVEMLVEPVCYENGIDLYDKGANIGLANLLFYTLPVWGGVDFFNSLLKNFQDMMRLRSEESYQAFFEPLFRQKYSEDLDQLLDFFRASYVEFGYELLETADHLDIAVSCTLDLMILWRKDIDDDIVLIHDNSSAMAKERKIWDTVVDPNLPSIEVGYDRRKAQFPIRVVKTCPEDSKSWAGLQLVDILAGAFTRCARWFNEGKNPDDLFGKSLAEVMGEAFYCFLIAPEKKFTPEQLGTTGSNASSPLDYFANLFMQNSSILQDRIHE